MKRDVIQLTDSETGDIINFHIDAFKELIAGIVAKYTNRSESEARALVDNHFIFCKPIKSYEDAIFFSHETEYHWAMLTAHGERYWQKGVPSDPPEGYDEWESAYLNARGLPASSFEWLTDN